MAKDEDETRSESSAPKPIPRPLQSPVQPSAPKAEAAPAPNPDRTGVRYTGRADVKRLSVTDLLSIGAQAPLGDLRWSKENGFVVPIAEVNDSTVTALVKMPDFSVV